MVTTVFANDGIATVTNGGNTAPAPGTVETWTLTASTLPAVSTGVSQCHAADPNARSEIILITNIAGATATVTRGAEGTTPVTHGSTFSIENVIAASLLGPLGGAGTANGVATLGSGGTLPISQGGTGAATQQTAINALTGTQSAGKVLRSDGTNASLATVQAGDLPAATGAAQGAVQLAGDLGGTASSPQVTGTHLGAPLPVAQGGTASNLRVWAGLLTPTAVKTGAYTAAAGDLVPCDTTSGAFTVTLPSAPADLSVVAVKHVIQGAANAVTVACAGTDVLNKAGGATSATLSLLAQGVLLQYSASPKIWYIYADDLPLAQLDGRYAQLANNLSDLPSASTARTNLGLGAAALIGTPVSIANGGTGQASQQAAIDALAGTQSAAKYLRSDGTHTTLAAIQGADVPTLNQNTTGTAAGLSSTLAIGSGGTGQTAAAAAFNALSPLTTLGDVLYGAASGAGTRLAGSTSATKNFLTQTGTGSASAAPAWGTIASGDLPAATTSAQGAVQLDATASDIKPTSTAAAAGSSTKAPAADHVHAQNYVSAFGDASDGAVNFDGTSTVLGLVPSTGVYTLTRDIFCTSLQVGGGGTATTIVPAGWRIFCQGTATIAANGTISAAGNAGNANGNVGTGTGSGSIVGGRAGGAGATGAGSAGTSSNGAGFATAGAGGASGANGGGTGGTAGSAATSWYRTLGPVLSGVMSVLGTTTGLVGAPGGGGGGGDGTNKGGGGGSGGGPVVIVAWSVVNSGTITTQGGAGGTPTTGNTGGGGGGSGGLILIYTLSAWTAGTTNVTGGGAGGHAGTGSSGNAGGNGTVLNVLVV